MNAQTLLRIIDQISYWIGKAFAWLILGLTMVVSIEVFKRYILNAPTSWIFDLNNMLYGTLFMMCGAYTLALAGHVRADFVYIYLKPRAQAGTRSRLVFSVFYPRHPRAYLCGLRLRRRFLAHRGAFECDGRGSAHLLLQNSHSDRRNICHASGPR